MSEDSHYLNLNVQVVALLKAIDEYEQTPWWDLWGRRFSKNHIRQAIRSLRKLTGHK